jgi:regulation of enolase protein 1 (concanavalin A-like superfamily)
MQQSISWNEGHWTHSPERVEILDGSTMHVTAKEGADAWRITSYGFINDSEHALIRPFTPNTAVEVTYRSDMSQQFDQAGLFIRADNKHWVKAGLEQSDGILQLGAVVTNEKSDWSVARTPEWNHQLVTVRASWSNDAITLRAKIENENFRLIRVFPFENGGPVEAGPYICAPSRAGFSINFLSWIVTDADASLHD